jgi:hypothetical protein
MFKVITNKQPNKTYQQTQTTMSFQNSKSFCKVCKDAGKSENEFTSHFTRSKPGPDGVLVCPYLLSIECRYCHEKGHTPKYCQKAKENHTYRAQQPITTPTRPKPPVVPNAPSRPKATNKFSNLELDEENPVYKPKPLSKKDIQYPQLSQNTKSKSKSKLKPTNLWAELASKKPLPDGPKPIVSVVDDARLKAIQEHKKWEKEHLEKSLDFMLDPHTYDDLEPYNDVVPNEDYLDEVYPRYDSPTMWGSYDDDDDCEYVSGEEEEDDGLWWGRDS